MPWVIVIELNNFWRQKNGNTKVWRTTETFRHSDKGGRIMKKRTKEAIESLLLALPCVLQTNDSLTDKEKAAGWRIFEKLLRSYINRKHRKAGRTR